MTRKVLLLLAVLAVLAGCGDGSGGGGATYTSIPRSDFAGILGDTMCRLLTEQCDCDRNFFGGFAQCASGSEDYLEGKFAEAEAAGLSYDPECAAAAVNLYNHDIACKLQSEITLDVSAAMSRPYCKVFYGTDGEGQDCESFGQAMGDSCAKGLQCHGVCYPQTVPRPVRLEGEACAPGTEICEFETLCLASETDATVTVCTPLPDLDETCIVGLGCKAPFTCDATTTTCVPLPGAGLACAPGSSHDLRCADGFYCADDETCTALPGDGATCLTHAYDIRCGPGLFCTYDTAPETCIPVLAEGELCDQDEACGELECREDASDEDRCLPEEALICI